MAPLSTPEPVDRPRLRGAAESLEARARQSIAAHEFLRDFERMKRAAPLGLVLWCTFGVFDYVSATAMSLGRFSWLAGVRFAVAVYLAAQLVALFQVRDPLRFTRAIEVAFVSVGTVMTTALTAMCVETGGFESLYAAGILLSTTYLLLVPRPSPKGALWILAVLIPYPLVLFGGALFLPELGRQLGSPRPMAFAGAFIFVGLAHGGLLALLGHVLWSMRREILESRSLGRYRIQRLLGRGGMGEVYAAYHHGLHREVAVKVLKAANDDEGAALRFEREIHATSALTHPNSIRLFDYGVSEDGRLFFVMELLKGETLRKVVERERPLAIERIFHIVQQASEALGDAHARGVVHRDVKADNLFVTRVGDDPDFIKVLDFGIASVLDDMRYQITKTGSITGTPATMSPEVILGKPATPAADVYALGTLLYWLVTGSYPFGDDAGNATLVAHVHEPVVPPSQRATTPISAALEGVILRCLAKDPSERFNDGRALALALRHARMASAAAEASGDSTAATQAGVGDDSGTIRSAVGDPSHTPHTLHAPHTPHALNILAGTDDDEPVTRRISKRPPEEREP